MRFKATVVIPAYNEQDSIVKAVSDVKALGPEYQIIVVDDGSGDNTATLSKEAGAEVISHPYNKGYGAALKTGINNAASDTVVLFDADSQHEAKDVLRMVEMMQTYDMVIGDRGKAIQTQICRLPGKWLLKKVAEFLVEHEIPDLNCGLRCLKRDMGRRFFPILPNGFSFTTTLTLAFFKEGLNVDFIPISTRKRSHGKSEVKFLRDGVKTLLLITRITALFNPLKIFVPAGMIAIATGIIYAIYHLIIIGFNIPTGAGLFILFGSLLIFFGILADQVSCMRRQIM